MPEFPKGLAYLWKTYHRIRRRKSMGFNGPNPIEWPDIRAFVLLTDARLVPWEVELIESIDDAFLNPAIRPTSPPQAKDKSLVNKVDISDGHGIRSLFRSIADRRKKKGG